MSASPVEAPNEEFAFPYGWWGIALVPCRPDVGTYGRYGHEFLPDAPPLDELEGAGYLMRTPRYDGEEHGRPGTVRAWRDRVINDLNTLNLPIPRGFRGFFLDHRRAYSIDSCTDCFFLFDGEVTPVAAGGHALPFYIDSQSCVVWSLYFPAGGGEPFVLAGDPSCTVDGVYASDPELGPFPHSRCADSFLEFVWRWDVENRIWFTTRWDGEELTDPELVDYVARYDADGEHARWGEDDLRWG